MHGGNLLGGHDDGVDDNCVNDDFESDWVNDETFSLQHPHCDRDPQPSYHLCILGYAGLSASSSCSL